MSFETGVDWSQQTSFLEQAAEVGAIAVNNSWSITSSLDEESAASVFSSGSAKNYIEAMKAFAQDGIIVFAMQNEYDATSAHVMAGIPLSFPELEDSFITAINVIPVFDEEGVISATRISAGCLETAAYCMAANGMLMTASDEGDDAYKFSTGASFAAPQIAGSLALLAEAFPDLSPQQLRARLLASADNGWFETTGVVEFADGITHGYNEEFGHGFLNLRDALLPIGSVGVPMADASGVEFGTMELGRAAISGGAMSGDAIAASLANIEIVAVDQLDGVFRLSGDAVAGVSEPVDLSAFRLASLSNGDLKAQRLSTAGGLLGDGVYGLGTPVMRELDALSLSGNFAHPVTAGAATLVEMIDDDTGSAGIRVKQGFSLGSGQLVLGFDARHEEGSVMGMTAPGYETAVEGSGYGMQFGLAHPLGSGFGLRIEGELGRAEGTGGGMIQSFDDIRYDSLRVSLDRGGVFDDDDILTFFASRPAVITSGSAKMTLPVAASGGVVSYAEHGVDLAPDARQLDLGVEYAAGLNAATELRLGAVASMNHGHAKSARDFQALASLQMRF